jgi:hypothetical protein
MHCLDFVDFSVNLSANKDLQKIKKISKGIAKKVQRLYQENWKTYKQYNIYK